MSYKLHLAFHLNLTRSLGGFYRLMQQPMGLLDLANILYRDALGQLRLPGPLGPLKSEQLAATILGDQGDRVGRLAKRQRVVSALEYPGVRPSLLGLACPLG